MKTLLKFSVMIFLFCISAQFVMAQDIIYKKSGKKIKVKVKEIGLDEINYVMFDDQDGILHSIAKDEIDKIKLHWRSVACQSYPKIIIL